MFGGKLSRDAEFFALFKQIAELNVKAAEEFCKLCDDFGNAETYVQNIKKFEHEADEHTHRTFELLHATFITPIDREDIHKLISSLDNVIDFIDATTQRINFYDVGSLTSEIKQFGEINLQSVLNIQKALRGMKHKNPKQVLEHCVEVNRLENDADHVLRSGVGKLFREEQDLRRLIKLKEIYELLEAVTDRCEDVTNVIEGIVLEYS